MAKKGQLRRRRRKLAVKRHLDLLIDLPRWIQQLKKASDLHQLSSMTGFKTNFNKFL